MVADWFDKPSPPSVTTNVTPRIPPCVGHASQDLDERPGDYLEERSAHSHYPEPATADLVKLWKKDRRVVLSITAGGRTQDFYMPPGRLAYLIKEVAEQLAENSILH
jgi:hypothetical protein